MDCQIKWGYNQTNKYLIRTRQRSWQTERKHQTSGRCSSRTWKWEECFGHPMHWQSSEGTRDIGEIRERDLWTQWKTESCTWSQWETRKGNPVPTHSNPSLSREKWRRPAKHQQSNCQTSSSLEVNARTYSCLWSRGYKTSWKAFDFCQEHWLAQLTCGQSRGWNPQTLWAKQGPGESDRKWSSGMVEAWTGYLWTWDWMWGS